MDKQPLGTKIARPVETSNDVEMKAAMKTYEDKPEEVKK